MHAKRKNDEEGGRGNGYAWDRDWGRKTGEGWKEGLDKHQFFNESFCCLHMFVSGNPCSAYGWGNHVGSWLDKHFHVLSITSCNAHSDAEGSASNAECDDVKD